MEQKQSEQPGIEKTAETGGQQSKTNSVALVALAIIVLAAGVGYSRFGRGVNVKQASGATEQPQIVATQTLSKPDIQPATTPSVADAVSDSKTFTLTAKNFSFSPSEIKVNHGDKVKIVLQNGDGFHDLVIDEFNARTNRISSGQAATVEFTADKIGSFEYYCSVGTHRQMGMKGTLIVR